MKTKPTLEVVCLILGIFAVTSGISSLYSLYGASPLFVAITKIAVGIFVALLPLIISIKHSLKDIERA